MADKSALSGIKKHLEGLVGRKIKVRSNGGRRKTVENDGVLQATYPSVFVVMVCDDNGTRRKVSFSYADLLTRMVELSVYEKGAEPQVAAR